MKKKEKKNFTSQYSAQLCKQGLFDFENQRVHAVSAGQCMWQAKGKDAIQY